jgi:hypothetical protein
MSASTHASATDVDAQDADAQDSSSPKIEALFLIRFDKKVGYAMRHFPHHILAPNS